MPWNLAENLKALKPHHQNTDQALAAYADPADLVTAVLTEPLQLGEDVKPLFAQVLMTCDSMGLIGKELFAIDGVKLPSNASKE